LSHHGDWVVELFSNKAVRAEPFGKLRTGYMSKANEVEALVSFDSGLIFIEDEAYAQSLPRT